MEAIFSARKVNKNAMPKASLIAAAVACAAGGASLGAVALAATAAAAQDTNKAVALAAARLGGVPVPGFSTRALPAATFAVLHAQVLPRPGQERWTEIPWQENLVRARQRAQRENRPMLLWIMDGHPLGCT